MVKTSEKLARQLRQRGWTLDDVADARRLGRVVRAANFETSGPATRYVHPRTGRSVIVDDATGEVLHVGGEGFGC